MPPNKHWRPSTLALLGAIWVLFVLDIIGVEQSIETLALSIIVLGPVVGIIILRLIGLHDQLVPIERMALCIPFGLGGSAFIFILSLLLPIPFREFVFVSILTLMIIADRSLSKNGPYLDRPRSLPLLDVLAICSVAALFVLKLVLIFPEFGFTINADDTHAISRSLVLLHSEGIRTPDVSYLGNDSFIGSILMLANPPLIFVKLLLPLLLLAFPLVFYVTAKQYLDHIDKRLAPISLLIWGFFLGFGWIYIYLNPYTGPEQLILYYDQVHDRTYGSAIGGIDLITWAFLPRNVALMFIVALFFLMAKNISKSVRIPSIAFLYLAAFLFHVTEAAMFAGFVFISSFLFTSRQVKLNETLSGIFIGSIIVIPVYLLAGDQLLFTSTVHTLVLFVIPPAIFGARTFHRRVVMNRGLSSIALIKSFSFTSRIWTHIPRLSLIVVGIMISVYILGLAVYFSIMDSFVASRVNEGQSFGIVPWFFYPVFLGINGLLALTSLLLLVRRRALVSEWQPILTIVFMCLFLVILGRTISLANENGFFTFVTETRIIPLLTLFISILSSYTILHLIRQIFTLNKSFELIRKNVAIAFLILIVAFSVPSTYTSMIYLSYVFDPDPEEIKGHFTTAEELSFMNKVAEIIHKQNAGIIAFEIRDGVATEFAGNTRILIINEQAASPAIMSASPELSTLMISENVGNNKLLYVTPYNQRSLEKEDAYLISSIIPNAPVIASENGFSLYNVTLNGAPSSESSTTFVIKLESSVEERKVHQMLLDSDIKHTTALEEDGYQLSRSSTVIYAYDPSEEPVLEGDKKIIIFNSSGYGAVGNNFITDGSFSQVVNGISAYPIKEQTIANLYTSGNTKAIAWYTHDGIEKVPLVMQGRIGNSDLWYFNVYPLLVSNSLDNNSKNFVIGLLEEILSSKDTEGERNDKIDAVFSSAILSGSIRATTTAVLFPPGQPMAVTLTGEFGKEEVIASKIAIKNRNLLHVKSIGSIIDGGVSYYTQMTIPSAEITGQEPFDVGVVSVGGNERLYRGTTSLEFSDYTGDIYLRSPVIETTGAANFEKLSFRRPLFSNAIAYNPTLTVSGTILMHVIVGNEYTAVSQLHIDGVTRRIPTPTGYNQIRPLYDLLPGSEQIATLFTWLQSFFIVEKPNVVLQAGELTSLEIHAARASDVDDLELRISSSVNATFMAPISIRVNGQEVQYTIKELSNPNLVAMWDFEGDEALIPNKSSNSNFGEIIGDLQRVSGIKGQGLKFDDDSSYVRIGHDKRFDKGSITIMGWVKTPDNFEYSGYRNVISNTKEPDERIWNVYLYSEDGSKVSQLFFSSGSLGDHAAILVRPYEPDSWHFMAITSDYTTIKFYSDGQPIWGSPAYVTKVVSHEDPIRIGRSDNSFKGTVDEIAVYDKPLTDEEINAIYNDWLMLQEGGSAILEIPDVTFSDSIEICIQEQCKTIE